MESLKEWINASLSAEKTRVSITDYEEDFKVSQNLQAFNSDLTSEIFDRMGWFTSFFLKSISRKK